METSKCSTKCNMYNQHFYKFIKFEYSWEVPPVGPTATWTHGTMLFFFVHFPLNHINVSLYLKVQSTFSLRNDPSIPKRSCAVFGLPGRRDSSTPYRSCSMRKSAWSSTLFFQWAENRKLEKWNKWIEGKKMNQIYRSVGSLTCHHRRSRWAKMICPLIYKAIDNHCGFWPAIKQIFCLTTGSHYTWKEL